MLDFIPSFRFGSLLFLWLDRLFSPLNTRNWITGMSLRSLLLVLGLSSLVAVGCGGGGEVEKLVPVGGTLLIDGKPLDGVVVTFTPAEVKKNSRGGSGTTDATGAFIVTHIDQNLPGLSPGKYSLSYSRMRLPNGSAAPNTSHTGR